MLNSYLKKINLIEFFKKNLSFCTVFIIVDVIYDIPFACNKFINILNIIINIVVVFSILKKSNNKYIIIFI